MQSNLNQVLKYIDEHLEEPITTAQLAQMAGYSEYHFSRMFKSYMQATVMEYVCKRRLIRASDELLTGSKVIDVAIKYGWQSHSGFTKAFSKEFGFCPSLLKGGKAMVSLRHFITDDATVLQKEQAPDLPIEKIKQLISDWNTNIFDGKYFEMFALTNNKKVIGTISLYEHSKNVASIGYEIFEHEQHNGYANDGMMMLMKYAKEKGYSILQQQIRADNLPSIKLHEKLGFESDGYVYQNKRGRSVMLYLKSL